MIPNVLKQIQLRGRVTASMVLLTMPQTAVQNILPSALSLAPQPYTPPGTHPVFFGFTGEENVHFVFNGHKFLYFKPYWEFVLEVPFVQKQGDAQPYFYPVRLYLNRLAPTLVGLLGYGFPKRMARFNVTENCYSIETFFSKRPLLSGEFQPTGDKGPISQFPNFQPGMFDMLNQPFLTHYPPIQNFPGLWLCSSFDYHFGPSPDTTLPLKHSHRQFEPAQIQAMPAAVQLDERFARKFFPGMAGSYTTPGIDESPLGSFRLWADWSLTPC